MSQLTDNLNRIASIKSDIKDAIEAKGVSMSGVSFGSYADKIGEIQTGGQFVTEPLSVSVNGTYTPGQGVDGFSQVTVNVPQGVTGYTMSDITATKYLSESVISDSTVSLIDIGRFVGERPITGLNQTTRNPIYGINTTHYYFQNCISVFESAFNRNSKIVFISLPNCTYIGNGVFGYCSSLQFVDFPYCGGINTTTFIECTSLSYASLPVCSYIGTSAFTRCNSLKDVYLPECEVLLSYCFESTSLTSISLSKCKIIYTCVFRYCTHLSSVYLGGVSSIGRSAFTSCSNLLTVILNGSSVCKLDNVNAFQNTPISGTGSGSIYVPTSLVDAYKSAANWSQYSSHIFPIPE